MSATSTASKNQTPAAAAQITTQALLAGDIIATRAHTANSVGVRVATLGTVSHAILYTGEKGGSRWAVDAMPEKGVTSEPLFYKLSQVSHAVVFRHRTATPEQCAKACAWASHQAMMHKPYDYNSAARAGVIAPYTNVSKLIIIADQIDAKLNPQGEDASFMCKAVPSKMLVAVLAVLLLMALGCRGGQVDTPAPDPASGAKGRYPVIYPTGRAIKFPEEQVIKKEIQVTTQWQTITFENPLKINRQGLMGLHLVVDQEPYISTIDTHPLNPECNTPDCVINAACLRRLSDGAIVRPEAVLVGDNGVEVNVRSTGHLYPYCDTHVMTMALRTFKDVDSPPPIFRRASRLSRPCASAAPNPSWYGICGGVWTDTRKYSSDESERCMAMTPRARTPASCAANWSSGFIRSRDQSLHRTRTPVARGGESLRNRVSLQSGPPGRGLDQYVVRRGEFNTAIAGFPWFLDWGRDTLIVVCGLIAAGRNVNADVDKSLVQN